MRLAPDGFGSTLSRPIHLHALNIYVVPQITQVGRASGRNATVREHARPRTHSLTNSHTRSHTDTLAHARVSVSDCRNPNVLTATCSYRNGKRFPAVVVEEKKPWLFVHDLFDAARSGFGLRAKQIAVINQRLRGDWLITREFIMPQAMSSVTSITAPDEPRTRRPMPPALFVVVERTLTPRSVIPPSVRWLNTRSKL